MKPNDQFGVTILAGGTLALLGLCFRILGVPPLLGVICVGLGVMILIEASYRLKKAKLRGPDTHGTMMAHAPSLSGRIRFFWFVAFGLVLASVLLIPVLPYIMGDPNSQIFYAVVPAQIVVVIAFLIYLRRRLFHSSGTGEGA